MKYYPFGKYILNVPDDHKIKVIHQQHPLYDRLYGEIIQTISEHNPTGPIVDIGANIGDTAAFFCTYAKNPVVAVEGSKAFLVYLQQNAEIIGNQVKVVDKFLKPAHLWAASMRYSGGSGTGALEVVENGAHGSVDQSEFASIEEILGLCSELGGKPSLIKSDTDGLDGFLVSEFIEKTNCPIYFECDTINSVKSAPTPWPHVFSTLNEMKYSVIIFDNHGIPMMVADAHVGGALRDLSGYIHAQHCAGAVRINYLDVWAFPPSSRECFETASARIRARYLRPYAF